MQWPVRSSAGEGTSRLFAQGGFFTPDRKARFIAPEPPALAAASDATFPLRLNTGRLRDQWHTMTRTGLSPRLASHRPVPTVEVSEADYWEASSSKLIMLAKYVAASVTGGKVAVGEAGHVAV